MEKMKLLFVSHESGTHGATISMVTLICYLQKRYSCSVSVILPYSKTTTAMLEKYNINYRCLHYYGGYRRIGEKRVVKEMIKGAFNHYARNALIRYVKKKKPEWIISNSTAVDMGAEVAVELGINHMFIVREFMEEDFGFEYIKKERMKYLVEKSEKCLFISNAVRDKYIKKYSISKSLVLWDGVIQSDYYIPSHRILTNPIIRIMQVGTMSDGKGTMELVQVIKRLRVRMNIHLTLIGDGRDEYKQRLREYIGKNGLEKTITLKEHSDDIRKEMENNDIMITNSRCEALGRVTVEGMLGGLLAIGRDAGGTREILQNKYGLLYADAMGLERTLIDIYNNREKYKRIAKNGQQYAVNAFSPDEYVRQMMEFLVA